MNKITSTPLLEWKVLFSALISSVAKSQNVDKYWCREGDFAYWFSRSAWALQAVAKWYETATGQQTPVFWIPDYFCNQALWPLRQTQAKIQFYPISESLNPDWDQCRKMAYDGAPNIFVLVHYFGITADGLATRQFCDDVGALLVEDAAHILMPKDKVGTYGDFVFYSPHKLLTIPDGAILIQRPASKIMQKLTNENSVNIMHSALAEFPSTAPAPWGWLAKQVLKKFLPACLWAAKQRMLRRCFADDPQTVPLSHTPRQSRLSQKLLRLQVPKLTQYTIQRRTNQAVLNNKIKQIHGIQPLRKQDTSAEIPYIAAYCCKTTEQTEDFWQFLKRKGCPVGTWPDLPPEVLATRQNHQTACKLRHTVLFLPLHQSLTEHAMNKMANRCLRRINLSKLTHYQLSQYEGDGKQWNAWIEKSGKSSLSQSWAYGQAKVETEGWKVKRYLILNQEQPFALFQALEKSCGLASVTRINRGPILLQKQLDVTDKQKIYQAIRKAWSCWRGRLLLIAPYLEDTPEHNALLTSSGFYCRKKFIAGSAWLDISQTEEALRKNLRGKWRNQLKKAERSEVSLKTGTTNEIFQWLMDNYAESMKKKGFKGSDVALLTKLHQQLANHRDLLVCQVITPEQLKIAGILLARHGLSCTYLIGWSGDEGRRLNANNYALWYGMLEMKRRGCKWFDLGGINDHDTPNIAHFKHGMNGKEYRLIGEWW